MALSHHGPRRKRRNPQQIHHSNATYGRLILMLMSVVSFLFGVVNVYVWTRSEEFLQQPPPMIKNEQKKPNSKNIENVDRRHHYHGSNDTGRARVVRLLQNAGVTDLSADTVRLLPTWQQITDLYGSHPRILVLRRVKGMITKLITVRPFVLWCLRNDAFWEAQACFQQAPIWSPPSSKRIATFRSAQLSMDAMPRKNFLVFVGKCRECKGRREKRKTE